MRTNLHFKIWIFLQNGRKISKDIGDSNFVPIILIENSNCWVVTILKKNYNKSHFVDQICDSTASRVQHKILCPVL